MRARRSSTSARKEPRRTTVRDIMTPNVITVTPDTSIARVAQLMDQNAVSGLPVIDRDRHVVGIITDHDLIIRNTNIAAPPFLPLLEGRIPLESPGHFKRRVLRMVGSGVNDVMSVDVKTIGPDEDVEVLADRMIKERMKVLPVVEGGRLAGIVTRADVIRWMNSR
jgi:CBS domain-containing protein